MCVWLINNNDNKLSLLVAMGGDMSIIDMRRRCRRSSLCVAESMGFDFHDSCSLTEEEGIQRIEIVRGSHAFEHIIFLYARFSDMAVIMVSNFFTSVVSLSKVLSVEIDLRS